MATNTMPCRVGSLPQFAIKHVATGTENTADVLARAQPVHPVHPDKAEPAAQDPALALKYGIPIARVRAP
jgi:hypothetical protein